MRIKPIGAGVIFREPPDTGATVCGYEIPPGTDISVFIEGAHLSEDMWENPRRFIPERFISSGSEDGGALEMNKRRSDVMPFSVGVRSCPGKHLAWMEILTVIPNLLNRYDFELEKGAVYNPKNIDPERENEPKMFEDVVYLTRTPIGHKTHCNLIIKNRKE
ncbi:hypothetical protein BB559_005968 [Furculomyces boomerangus]|uniref:Cytochrome P450 n=2 Tax=Harpellales TaxID=61421 RepID=A0A2T9Y5M4_9FUNG|nr:hypothetical protein BB559_005968 [Furculomyces boomerangus]